MSKVEVNQVTQQCGTTLTVGGGACKTAVVDATTVTLGRCGGTVSLASGATQSGFGRTGTVDWDTSIKTGTVTAVTGKGYFVDTTSGGITVNLPAAAVGSIVAVSDYASTSASNNITVTPNGSEKINGTNAVYTISTAGLAVTLVYADATRGWKSVTGSNADATGLVPAFITATGGTPSQFGDYEIRTFTGPGTFTVCSVGNPAGSDAVDYVVTGGGGGGGTGTSGGSGGGGAGGYRAFTCQPVTATGYPVVVGGGGPGKGPGVAPQPPGTGGNVSTFRCNSSAGGGFGASQAGSPVTGGAGGSGGGGAWNGGAAGAGNTPPTPVSQGNPGGAETNPGCNGGAGGGAVGVGSSNTGTCVSPGGAGADISPLYGTGVGASGLVAGGGGGGGYCAAGGVGGTGGGGAGVGGPSSPRIATNGTDYTGGGGGGATAVVGPPAGPSIQAGNGGSGVVIIRYKFQ